MNAKTTAAIIASAFIIAACSGSDVPTYERRPQQEEQGASDVEKTIDLLRNWRPGSVIGNKYWNLRVRTQRAETLTDQNQTDPNQQGQTQTPPQS